MLDMSEYRKRWGLSVSSMSNLGRCPRLFYYKNGLGLERCGRSDDALKFGEAVHYALPWTYEGDLGQAIKAFNEIWQDREGDKKRNQSVARSMLLSFMSSHQKGSSSSLYDLTPPPESPEGVQKLSKNEVWFAVDIGLPVPVVGRVDACGKHRDTGEWWGVEYKTSTRMSTWFLQNFELSPQLSTYVLGLQESSGQPCRGVLLEGLLVAASKSATFVQPFYISGFDLEELISWYKNLWKMLEIYENEAGFPKNFACCSPYTSFGSPGYVCEFAPLCQAKEWEELLSMYIVKPENPCWTRK